MTPLVLTAFTAVNALGYGVSAITQALRKGMTGLRRCTFEQAPLDTYTGMVMGLEAQPVAAALAHFDCRNNRLAQATLLQDQFVQHVTQARQRYGALRIAVIVGTSTSGILETEHAYRKRDPSSGMLPPDYQLQYTHNLYATADFVQQFLQLQGPALVISTACSSSAKVFAAAQRMMALDLCDAAVVGGVDSLCLNTLYGFSSLELIAREPCRPCSADRAGISIGEGGGFALLERPGSNSAHSGVNLLGYGESADAYHMSSPRPDGAGAALAMTQALAMAELTPADIDYINMHGTASQVNDTMEDKAITTVFGIDTACSSTKGWTGHTLGAAGITEAVISAICIQEGFLPGSLNTQAIDPSFNSRILLHNNTRPVARVMSNSFGFGGSNCSLIFGRAL